MKYIGSARYARERERHARGKGTPPLSITRERNLHMITKAQLLCQLNAFCQETTDVFYYSACSKLCTDSLIASITCIFVEKLIFESFVVKP